MFSLKCDKYTNVLNKQQLPLYMRWVDTDLNAC